jgi:hypothetical protein
MKRFIVQFDIRTIGQGFVQARIDRILDQSGNIIFESSADKALAQMKEFLDISKPNDN